MSDTDKLGWTIPVMQAGYAGRGLVYLVVAGLSLWAIWLGGEAEGTSSTLAKLEGGALGRAVLVAMVIGLMAYMIWRVICAAFDLEDEGDDGKGTIARLGQATTGILHGIIGVAIIAILIGASGDSGGGSKIAEYTGKIMEWPFGRVLIGIAGLCTIGAGIYYLFKAWKEKYREDLEANHFTRNWNPALKAGVAAQGVVVTMIGAFLTIAAFTANPNEAGGMGQVFDWLKSQAFGNILVVVICLGLLGFSLFCFVNAAYRIIPKVAGDDVQTLASKAKDKAS